MKYKWWMIFAALAVAGCDGRDGSSSGSSGSSASGEAASATFFEAVLAIAITQNDEAEPVSVDSFPAGSSDEAEPTPI